MTEVDESHYNNSNRAFLQAFIARSVLTFDEAKPILAAILTVHERKETLPEDVTEADFNSYITAANSKISAFDLEIRSTYHQTTRQRIYSLVNSTSDPITQLATIHTADEISFLKRVLDAMFETYNTKRQEVMAINSMQAMKLAKPPSQDRRESQDGATQGSSGQGLTMVQAEKLLKTLVEEGWFEKSMKGYYSLSARALMELRGWLVETYNDADDDDEEEEPMLKVKQCVACKEVVTVGQRCDKRSCACRLHDICTQNFFRIQKSKKCPMCKTEWTGTSFVGERAVTSLPKSKQGGRRSGATQRRPSSVAVESEEAGEPNDLQDEDEEEAEEEEEAEGDDT